MEARAEFRQPRISKSLVAIVAVSIALGLGVMAGTVAKNLNGSATTATQNHTVLQGKGGLAVQSVRHGGMQTAEEKAAPVVISGVSPDAADRKAGQKLPGNAFVAPDAADHNQSAAPIYYAPDTLGFREGN
jgi:hypothetical protein